MMLISTIEGWDVTTVTVIGTVICGIITALSVAIVKILGAVQELKVAAIKAAEERNRAVYVAEKAAEKTAENAVKLSEIGAHTNGNLDAMSKRLDGALQRIDDMHKAALAQATGAAPSHKAETEDNPGNVKNAEK